MGSTARRATMLIALVIFIAFLTNVALGSAGLPNFLGDVGEAVTLFIAVAFFIAGILLAEAADKANSN